DTSLEPHLVVLANRADTVPEIGALRSVGRRQERDQRPLELSGPPRPLVDKRKQIAVGAGMEAAEERQDLVADEPALRPGVRRVVAVRDAALLAVANRVL